MAQTVFSAGELLTSHPFAEPLMAGGVRCHGGFDEDGRYLSPRTLHRWPAIRAWQAQHEHRSSAGLLDVELDRWPEHYPNVAQARHLISSGRPEPIIAMLTRIGTVEGFGAMIRHVVIPDLDRLVAEDLAGTASDHLGRGLYEAHARDEAGHGDEGGHKQMWFAARDIAFEDPVTEDETALMLFRMGLSGPPGSSPPDPAAARAAAEAARLWPPDLPFDLEMLVERMVRLLLIEVSAFHTFAWAEELLSDGDLVAGEGEAARLVSYIRADEQPHVEYLRTVLSELRDCAFTGDSGRRHDAAALIAATWERAVADSLGSRRRAGLDVTLAEVEHALEGSRRRDDLLEEFHALGAVRPGPQGWVDAKGVPVGC